MACTLKLMPKLSVEEGRGCNSLFFFGHVKNLMLFDMSNEWFMGFMDWVVFHCFFCIVAGIALGVFKRYQPPSSQGGPKIDKSSMMLDCFPGSLEPWAMMNHYYLSMYQASFNLDAPCIHKQQNQLHISGRARWKAPATIHLQRGGHGTKLCKMHPRYNTGGSAQKTKMTITYVC